MTDQLTLDVTSAADMSAEALRTVNRGDGQRIALLALSDLHIASDFDLQDHTGIIQTSIGKRRGELVGRGLVKRSYWDDGSPVRGITPSGSSCAKWQLTEAGIAEARLERALS